MRLASRILLSAAAFLGVLYLPGLFALGPTGASTDLRLGALLTEGSVLAFGVAFAGGVATSLTPCVYPLIPITVSIFGARKAGTRREALALSGLYVLGIAAMYSALGVGAALTGKAFGSVMQNPWVIGFVALVLAAMAASMFGAFELRLPSSWQGRLNAVGGAGKAGAFGMGLVSGIIAAPCTGPVLAAALTFVATRGSVAFGFAIMFVYALGIGLLFFLIGAFSISLPKSGPWMETVKSVFGVALLAAAGVFLSDTIPAAKPLFSAARGAGLAAAAAAAAGVLLGALHASFSGSMGARLAKAAGVLLLVGGIVYGAGVSDARERERGEEGFAWLRDEDEALALAKKEGRPVIIDFWADWCTACKELDRIAWADPRVRAEASRFVAVKLDGTDESEAFQRMTEKYGIVGMPTVVFIDPRGREVPERVTAAIPGEEMLETLRRVDGACDGVAAERARPDPLAPSAPGATVVACAARW
jgi:thiol:disulfide interchange protein DsbD